MEQGYKISYIALAPGVYYVTIKYSGIHIPGSPFKVIMEGKKLRGSRMETSFIKIDTIAKINKAIIDQVPIFPGNANKVIVNGSGLHKFSPGQLAIFNIDTALAGDNILYVGLFTSKGPCNEVTLQHLGNGQYTVKYLIDEQFLNCWKYGS
ncbi:Filamin-A [Dirofilaria immitis]